MGLRLLQEIKSRVGILFRIDVGQGVVEPVEQEVDGGRFFFRYPVDELPGVPEMGFGQGDIP